VLQTDVFTEFNLKHKTKDEKLKKELQKRLDDEN
jgi:hypothetical protein